MCNRCQDVCPAYTTGKELSPSALEINKRYLHQRQPQRAGQRRPVDSVAANYAISESAVWACTACGACVQICPVGNEPMFDILYMRRNQVLMESNFPHELQAAYRGMERSGNPWNLARKDRMAWARGLEIATVEDNPDFDVLWWVGCAPSYDLRAQKTATSFAQVLDAAGVNYAVLGDMENCTGNSARQLRQRGALLRAGLRQHRGAERVRGRRKAEADRHHLSALYAHAGQGISTSTAAATRSSTAHSSSPS